MTSTRALFTLAVLCLSVVPLPAPSIAFAAATSNATTTAASTPPATVDTWLGVVAAMGCGIGVRYFPAIAVAGVGGICGVVAVCALMLVDAYETPDGS